MDTPIKLILFLLICLAPIALKGGGVPTVYCISILLLLVIMLVLNQYYYLMMLFMISSVMPQFVTKSLHMPFLNQVSLLFGILFISLMANTVFKSSFNIKWPSTMNVCLMLIATVVFIGSVRTYLNGQETLLRAISTYFLKPTLILFGTYIISYNYFLKNKGKKELWLIYGIIILVFTSFYISKFIYGLDKEYAGFLGTGNETGLYLVIALPLLFAVKKSIRINNILHILIIILTVSAILLSGSRASIVALCVVAVAAIVFFTKISFVKKIFMASILGLFLYAFCSHYLIDILNSIPAFDSTETGHISSGRTKIWEFVFEYLQNPTYFWFGGGTNDFLLYVRYVFGPWGTHNHFLRIWVDYGLVGLIIVSITYFTVIFKAIAGIKSYSEEVRTISWCLIFTFISLSVTGLFYHFEIGSSFTSSFWILVGWFTAASERDNSSSGNFTDKSSSTSEYRILKHEKTGMFLY